MCLPLVPLLAISVAMSAAATGASLIGQKQQADAQEKYQKQLAAANVQAAQVQSSQVRDQQAQSNEANARDMQQARLASLKAQSTGTVAAGEAGVAGSSVDALLRDYRAQEGVYKEAILRQRQLTDVSAGQQIDAIRAGADTGNLSMNAPVAQPNYLAGALSFGAQAAGTFAAASRGQPKTGSTTFTGAGRSHG